MSHELKLPMISLVGGVLYPESQTRVDMSERTDEGLYEIMSNQPPHYILGNSGTLRNKEGYSNKY
jgi:hypothetical protein